MALIKSRNHDITDAIIERSVKGLTEFGIVDDGDARRTGIATMTDARWGQIHDQIAGSGIAKLGG